VQVDQLQLPDFAQESDQFWIEVDHQHFVFLPLQQEHLELLAAARLDG